MDELYQAPVYKRIISGILDQTMAVLLAIGLFMLLANGAVDIGFHNLSYKVAQFQLQEESCLFDITKDGQGNYLGVAPLTYDTSNKNDYKRFVERIHSYYVYSVPQENRSNADFNKKFMLFDANSCKNAVFSIESIDADYTSYALLDVVKDVLTNKSYNQTDETNYYGAVANFFVGEGEGVYHLALTEFTSSEKFQSIQARLEGIERLEALICTAVSTLVMISLPVLINKHGETAFMHLLSICFVDSYGYRIKWRNKILRAIVVLILNSVSIYLFAIPLAVNAIVYLATPSKRSLVDIASGESGIDKRTSVILDE